MASKNDRPYDSGGAKAHGVNVQVIADPAGRLIWASPALPGARHDAGAAAEHGIPHRPRHGRGDRPRRQRLPRGRPHDPSPYRKSRFDRATGKFVSRPLSVGMKGVNRSIAQLRAPGERANADLKSWRILRKIRSSPAHATTLVNAVQTLILYS